MSTKPRQPQTPAPLRLALCRTSAAFSRTACLSDAQMANADWPALLAQASQGPLRLGAKGEWLLLPALDAAKAHLHPLALLQGYARGANAIHEALIQAGRSPADAEILFERPGIDTVIEHAEKLAGRTHPVYGGYWSHPRYQARVLALVGAGDGGENQTLVLTQGSARIGAALNGGALPWLLPLALPGGDWSAVQRRLTQIQAELNAIKSDEALAALVQQAFDDMTPGCRAIVLIGADAKSLVAEAASLSWRLAESLRDDIELSTPAGSVFSPSPSGPAGLAFVYPGVGTASSEMLADMHLYFPAQFDALDQDCRQHGLSGLDGVLLPRELGDDPRLAELAVAGVGASVLMTRILEGELGIKPALCLGYSMGEAAMIAARGLWQDPFAMVGDTLKSELFADGISGKLEAVRAHWQLGRSSELNWKSLVLRLNASEIRAHLSAFPKVAIAISQGPSTVLSGSDTELKRLVKELGKRGLDTKLVTAMHTPAAQSMQGALAQFYQRPMSAPLPKDLPQLLSAGAERLTPDSDAIANAIAATFANELKFDELIVRAYKAGGRIFAEVGAGREASCIVQAIGDDKLMRLTAQPSDGQQGKALQKLLARLIAHSIPMNLSRLRPAAAARPAQETTP
ncbi:PfaB family protein [Shewanella sp. JM162201]|uniref:PfaB family protein n=1 Tax=Shewanella jiangmenensis TaxID=2837387 RepID=A0ABS5V4I9_9GAMM|nr:PfaB family protein [Shewanella jiangmenensis]MBT1444737.1 PfaB family protein [Shewanella jiangmenensis]